MEESVCLCMGRKEEAEGTVLLTLLLFTQKILQSQCAHLHNYVQSCGTIKIYTGKYGVVNSIVPYTYM